MCHRQGVQKDRLAMLPKKYPFKLVKLAANIVNIKKKMTLKWLHLPYLPSKLI